MTQKYLNNFQTQFIAAVKAAPDTASPATELDYGILRVSDGAAGVLLNPAAGDWYVLTAFKRSGSAESDYEILRITAVDNSVLGECRLTVQRGQEGTAPKAYAAGDIVELRLTAGGISQYVQDSDPRMTNARPPTGAAGGVLSGTYPNPTFAQAMATAADLNGKVDKVTGKVLSSNDFTNDQVAKLAGIAEQATKNATDAQLRDRATHTGAQAISTVTGLQTALDAKAPTANPTFTGTVSGVTKAHVGLGNVDNTSDANKPVSTAQQAALEGKVSVVAGKQLSTEDYTTAEKTKLAGIATGATANDTDANLKNRANHTGTQAISTVSGLQTALDGKQLATVFSTTAPASPVYGQEWVDTTDEDGLIRYTWTPNGSGGGNWVNIDSDTGIEEAPADGKTYGRKNAAWSEITAGGQEVGDILFTARTPPSPPYLLANGAVYLRSAYPALSAVMPVPPATDPVTRIGNPDVLPANFMASGQSPAWSPDGQYLTVSHGSTPFITTYKRSGDAFTKLANPATLPGAGATGVAWSPDGTHLAVGTSNAAPYLYIYRRDGDVLTRITTIDVAVASPVVSVAYSDNGQYLAVRASTSGTNSLYIYKRSGEDYVRLSNPATGAPSGSVGSVVWGGSDTYLAMSDANNSTTICVLKRDGDTFTRLANVTATATVLNLAFSKSGDYLVVVLTASTALNVFKRSGDTFTAMTAPAALAGNGQAAAFSPDDKYLGVAHATSPYVTLYQRSGDTFTKLPNVASPMAGTGTGVSFWFGPSAMDNFMAVNSGTTPYIGFYRDGYSYNPLTELQVPDYSAVAALQTKAYIKAA